MQNRTSKELFELIKGMSKWEKKNFSRYAKRNSNSECLKVLSLFRALNSMDAYNEKMVAQKMKGIQCRQLPGLKVYLYNQILDSLRICKKEDSIVLQLHQLMDHANILYDKGFWAQSLKVLQRLKNIAASYHQISFLFQASVLERKLELLYGTCRPEAINQLNREMAWCSQQFTLISQLSNQSMLLYGWHKRYGILRNEEEQMKVDEIFGTCCNAEKETLSFYPKLYFLQAKTYYYQLKADPAHFYASAMEWVAHFRQNRKMMETEPLQYQRGLSYLNEAALHCGQADALYDTGKQLEGFIDRFYQLSSALNLCLFERHVDEPLLGETHRYVQALHNPARLIKLCYQAARLCVQEANYERAIDFIRIVMNQKTYDRIDLQYKVRLLQLEVHQKLNNDRLAEYLALSARRFAKAHGLVG